MGSEHKSKKRGRSTSPAKKKSKRKYRNDRSKKSRHSSSESTSSEEEDISLTSDEYPSSAEEKRSKKSKKKSRASSASSSRSPTPVKKKSKSKDDKDDSKKDKHKKDRKRSPSSKKKRRRSRSDESDSSESGDDSPVRKEKSKKKRSPSPVRVKKKKSVSPVKEVEKKKKRSVSPAHSKKKTSTSPPRKAKGGRSPSPVKKKKSKSPTRVKKRSVSPVKQKNKSPPRGGKDSGSPTSKKEKKVTPISSKTSPTDNRHKKGESPGASRKKESESTAPQQRRKKESESPTPQPRHKKESETPAPRKKSRSPSPRRSNKESGSPTRRKKSPSPHRSKKESRSPAPRKKSRSPPRHSKRESETPDPVKKGKSPTPDKAKKESQNQTSRKKSPSPSQNRVETRSPSSVKKAKSPEKKVEPPTPVQHPLKCPSPTSTSRMLTAKSDAGKSKKETSGTLPKATQGTSENHAAGNIKVRAGTSILPKTKAVVAVSGNKIEFPTTEIKRNSDITISLKTKISLDPIDLTSDKIDLTSDKTVVILDKAVSTSEKTDATTDKIETPSNKIVTTLEKTDAISEKINIDLKKVKSITDAAVVDVQDAKASLPPSTSEEQKGKPLVPLLPEIPIATPAKPPAPLPSSTPEQPTVKPTVPLPLEPKIEKPPEPVVFSKGNEPATTNPLPQEKKTVENPSIIKKSASPSVFRIRNKKSPSPTRNRKKSRSPSPSRIRKRSRSSSPRARRRSKSPKRDRKRSRSRSPHRHRKDERAKSPLKQRRRSRSSSPIRSKKDRERSPDKKRKNDDKRKDDERGTDKRDREEKDKDKLRRSDDHRRSGRDDRSNKDDKDRRKKDEKDQKSSKRDKSPDKKDINELEEEMRKRKERIEAWRNANRKKDETNGDATDDDNNKSEKKWSLEDDDEDDDEEPVDIKEEETNGKENGPAPKSQEKKERKDTKKADVKEKPETNEDDDPLDCFMKGIEVEVNKTSGKPTTTGTKTKTITVVKTVVSKTSEQAKPEVMEQNQDALEYSSEEEGNNDIQASDFTDVTTKRKKELTVADHSKIYYASFRKHFYVEVPELARMSADEVKLLRDSLGDIQVRGKNSPKPIKTWAQAGLSAKVMNVLKKCQYDKPTPIQAQALPIAMSGRDMIGIAKTGSGKTLAFVLPMLRHVLDQPALDEGDGPLAIIMTPTRELALQIHRESKKFCKALNLNVSCIYGGSGISEQIAELKRGTEIIVCTPGRMIDMLAANNGRVTNCRRCTYLVLDEADRMFDMGFEPQVMRILDNIRPDRQTVLFSATFPRQMEAMARKVLTKPIEVQVGGRSVVCSDVEQHAIVIEEDNKFFKILELLGVYQEKGSILLFVERQETADRLFKDLLKKGYPCLSLHGGMDQFDRDSTIADFKNGVTRLMVSTSVAARGLDVKNLILVINFDCPNHYEDYVHRVGRTGRAGNKGTAFTFVTPEQGRNAGDIIKAFDLSKCEMPEDVLTLWNSFREDMEKEGKTIKMNSGFSGKGFKFNAEEDAQVNEEKKMRKFTLGLQDSDDEAEAAENAMDKIEADLEKIFSSKPKVALQPEVVEAQKVKVAEQNVDKDKLKQASTIAALINKKLSSGQVMDRNTAATAHIMQGGALESLTGVGLAKQLADKVNAKLNYKAAEVENQVDEKPTLVRYEEEIDINDFPQQARWRITSKEIIEQVRELSEAGVTVRGLYIPPNKKPTEEEKRLHLYIESLSERSIQIAKAEIKRLLKEELIKAESNTYRPAQQTGRYKVL